jgi:hypothetical protein
MFLFLGLPAFLLIAILALFILDVVFFSFEKYEWSIGVMVASIAAAYFFQPDFHNFVLTGWVTILTKYIPFYLLGGLATAVAKWIIHNFKAASKIGEAKKEFDANHDKPDAPIAQRRQAFVKFFESYMGYRSKHKIYTVSDFNKETAVVDALTPRAKDNVGIITIWIFQWPVVIVATLFEDLIVKLAKNAARVFDALFSAASRALVGRVTKGL